MMPFAGLHIDHIGLIIYHAIMASLMLALIGMMGGIWADKFDHMAAITNFVITPLAFLSGDVLFHRSLAGTGANHRALQSVLLYD